MTTFQIILTTASLLATVGFCYWTYRMGRKPTVEEWLLAPVEDLDEFHALISIGFTIEKEAEVGLYIASHEGFRIHVVGTHTTLSYEALKSTLALLETYKKLKP